MMETSIHSENEYVKGIAERDGKIIREIYDLYVPKIIKFITLNSGTKEDAHDIFQEAIVVIYKKATVDILEIKKSFYNYLYTICRNIWLQELSKRKQLRVTSIDLREEDIHMIHEESEETSFDKQVRWVKSHKLYVEKFKELGGGCQKVLMSFFEGKSMKEIAIEMGFSSEGYAKKRKYVCSKKLTEAIKNDVRYQGLI